MKNVSKHRKSKLLAPLLVFGLMAGTAAAAPTANEQANEQAAEQQVRAGTFSQTKQLVGLSRALKSSGTFTISEAEVLWTTTTPLFSEVLISGDAVRERYTPDGEFQVTAQGESVTTVSRVLALIVQNDIDGLQRYFVVQQQGNSSQLTPRSEMLKALFERIDIQQQAKRVNVHIAEASGSSTHILLQPETARPDTLQSDSMQPNRGAE